MAEQENAPSKSKRQEHIEALEAAKTSLKETEELFEDLDLKLKDLRKKIDCMPHDPHIGGTQKP